MIAGQPLRCTWLQCLSGCWGMRALAGDEAMSRRDFVCTPLLPKARQRLDARVDAGDNASATRRQTRIGSRAGTLAPHPRPRSARI